MAQDVNQLLARAVLLLGGHEIAELAHTVPFEESRGMVPETSEQIIELAGRGLIRTQFENEERFRTLGFYRRRKISRLKVNRLDLGDQFAIALRFLCDFLPGRVGAKLFPRFFARLAVRISQQVDQLVFTIV